MNTFRRESNNPKWNAQHNLAGRTHYVDDATLRWHKSRIIKTAVADGGLLFALIETCPKTSENDPHRIYRPVIFDLFGTVVERVELKDAYNTRKQAEKAMWETLNALDAKQITLDGIAQAERYFAQEMAELKKQVNGDA